MNIVNYLNYIRNNGKFPKEKFKASIFSPVICDYESFRNYNEYLLETGVTEELYLESIYRGDFIGVVDKHYESAYIEVLMLLGVWLNRLSFAFKNHEELKNYDFSQLYALMYPDECEEELKKYAYANLLIGDADIITMTTMDLSVSGKDKIMLVKYKGKEKFVYLPDFITELGKYSFMDTVAKRVYLPAKLEKIDDMTFCDRKTVKIDNLIYVNEYTPDIS